MSILCAVPLISSLMSACLPPLPLATGYVEGEYVLMAPVEIAQVERIVVRRGDRVAAGQDIVFLEKRDAEIALAEAVARLSQAKSNLANISLGRRPEEIAVLEASLESARAQARESARELDRQRGLLARDITSQAQHDQAETKHKIAEARVVELQANLHVAQLPARADEIEAAEAAVEQARAAQAHASWRLSKRTLAAVTPGTVTDMIRNVGEVAGPQAPVLALLPDGAVKLKLYVPEVAIAKIALGDGLAISCDGCMEGLTASVSYIAEDPEFTPPVIYSLENRQKLVYLVEARIADDQDALKPGQIVHVDLVDAGQ